MPLANEIDEVLEEVIFKCSKSIKLFCQTFFPRRFYNDFSPQHERLFEVIDDRSIQKVLFIAHRGFGKTSLFNYAIPAQHIVCHKLYYPNETAGFIVPISATATFAQFSSENLKKALIRNPYIKELFGDIRSDSFSQEVWVTANNIQILPRSPGGQIRGMIFEDVRPQLILPDDLEKTEEVMSDEQRRKLSDWFASDVLGTPEVGRRDWRILMSGTILHENSLLEEYRDDPTWEVVEAPLCDDNLKSYWPAFMTDEQVVAKRDEYKRHHKLDSWAREYLNQAVSSEDAVFQQEYFKYYDESEFREEAKRNPDIQTVIIVDPAKTEKVHNDFTGIVGIGLDLARGRIYLRDLVNKHLYPDQIYEELFAMAERLNAQVIGYEVTGLSEFITQPMRNEMLKRGKVYELVELHARKGQGEYATKNRGKEGRVAQLVLYYRIGAIYHNKAISAPMETQLLAFPRAKHWDLMDPFAYIIQMMDLGERFFEEQHADEKEEEFDSYESPEDFERAVAALSEENTPAEWEPLPF